MPRHPAEGPSAGRLLPLAFAVAACLLASSGTVAASMDSIVYAMDNQYDNKIHAYRHGESDEELILIGSYNTGGSGFIRGFESPTNVLASSISVLRHNGFLFNVNAGSNSVSSFKIRNNGSLQLRGVTPTEGVYPVGFAAMGDHLCVVSAEGPEENANQGSYLECFMIGRRSGGLCRDTSFENGVQLILGPIARGGYFEGPAGGATDPEDNGPIIGGRTVSQASFTPEGDALVAVVKATGVFVFPIVNDQLTAPKIFTNEQYASAVKRGITDNFINDAAGIPFSFLFKTGPQGERYFVITEPVGVDGTDPGTGGGISTFTIDPSADVPLVQIDDTVTRNGNPLVTPCWIADLDNFLWTANTNEGSVQTFKFDDQDGTVSVVGRRERLPRGHEDIDPAVAASDLFVSPRGTLPLDISVSGDCFGKRFLYVVDAGFHRIVTYEIDETNGDLERLGGRASGVMPIQNLDYDEDQHDRQVSGPAVHGVASVCLPSRS